MTFKAATAWSRNLNFVDKYLEWTRRVNDKGAGKIRIDYIGGPEVYPSFEQLEPLKRGVFATVITSTAYVAGGAYPADICVLRYALERNARAKPNDVFAAFEGGEHFSEHSSGRWA